MIDSLHQDNKELHIQVKVIKDLNKANTSSHDSQQERHFVLKERAINLKFKSPVSSAKSKEAADAAPPSS